MLETETLSQLPTGRGCWTAVRLVPGSVVTGSSGGAYDVGGTGSLVQSFSTVHGTQTTETRYYVDGFNVTNPASPGFASSYLDTSMFQEFNLRTGNATAEVESGGVAYSLITKTGTNAFRGSFLYTGSSDELQANNLTPALRQQLLAAVPSRALQANPNLEPSAKIVTFYNIEGSVSGPIVRDKLWFAASTNRKPLDQFRVGSYNPDGTQFVDDNLQWNYGAKLTWQASPRNHVHYVRQTSNRTAFHRVVGNPTASYESNATQVQELRYRLGHGQMDISAFK